MAMGVADHRAWVICVTVLAADAEMDAITDRIGAAICGSLDHPGPCTNSWDILTVRFDDLDDDDRVLDRVSRHPSGATSPRAPAVGATWRGMILLATVTGPMVWTTRRAVGAAG